MSITSIYCVRRPNKLEISIIHLTSTIVQTLCQFTIEFLCYKSVSVHVVNTFLFSLGMRGNFCILTFCSGFVDKTQSWEFWKLFPTGTYAIIGTTCVEFENVMKRNHKKKDFMRRFFNQTLSIYSFNQLRPLYVRGTIQGYNFFLIFLCYGFYDSALQIWSLDPAQFGLKINSHFCLEMVFIFLKNAFSCLLFSKNIVIIETMQRKNKNHKCYSTVTCKLVKYY